jgi:hypothetical protein
MRPKANEQPLYQRRTIRVVPSQNNRRRIADNRDQPHHIVKRPWFWLTRRIANLER